MQGTTYPSHSARVEMWIEADGRRLEVIQSDATRVKLAQPAQLPIGPASFFIRIDGQFRSQPLRLPHGASLENAWVMIEDRVQAGMEAA